MKFLHWLGIHDWSENCELCTCGRTRVGRHVWQGCRCSTCPSIRDEGHDWTRDCEKCRKCPATRDHAHNYASNCEECSICHAKRLEAHQWQGCVCSVCKTSRDFGHEWTGTHDQVCRLGGHKRIVHSWGSNCRCVICEEPVPDELHEWKWVGSVGDDTYDDPNNRGYGGVWHNTNDYECARCHTTKTVCESGPCAD